MKKFASVLALILVVALLAACGDSTKDFTFGELTITAPARMTDASDKADFQDYTFTLDSRNIAIFGLQESYEEYPVLLDYSLEEYAELVLTANERDALVKRRSSGNYHYFDYIAETGAGTYRYLVGCFETDEGFWTVQVCAKVTDFELETFLGYLDSVRFS